jgi:NAD(P)-dependent dehydrogenase (short-subunit alcohol dehydrogenase family)
MNRTRSIFISGAAHGIGRATAVLFHHRGWRVAAADIDAAGLADLAQQLGTERWYRYTLDVSDVSQWRSVLAEVVWRCAHYRGNRVHWRIGWQTKLAYSLSKLSPAWLNRWVNGWLNRS